MLPGFGLRRRAAAESMRLTFSRGDQSPLTVAAPSAADAVRRRSAAARAASRTRSSPSAHPAPGRPAHRGQTSGLPGEPSPDAADNADRDEQFAIRRSRAWRSAGAPDAQQRVLKLAAWIFSEEGTAAQQAEWADCRNGPGQLTDKATGRGGRLGPRPNEPLRKCRSVPTT